MNFVSVLPDFIREAVASFPYPIQPESLNMDYLVEQLKPLALKHFGNSLTDFLRINHERILSDDRFPDWDLLEKLVELVHGKIHNVVGFWDDVCESYKMKVTKKWLTDQGHVEGLLSEDKSIFDFWQGYIEEYAEDDTEDD